MSRPVLTFSAISHLTAALVAFLSLPLHPLYYDSVFFFFQAEDGIRDIGVTGVQTCALPICPLGRKHIACELTHPIAVGLIGPVLPGVEHQQLRQPAEPKFAVQLHVGPARQRSEERRVGKESRSRWSPYH